jgi:hypothetical protein
LEKPVEASGNVSTSTTPLPWNDPEATKLEQTCVTDVHAGGKKFWTLLNEPASGVDLGPALERWARTTAVIAVKSTRPVSSTARR